MTRQQCVPASPILGGLVTFTEYVVVLQRRWRVWGTCLASGLLVAAVLSMTAQVQYTARSTSFVTVAERSDGGQGEIFQGSQFAVQRVRSYAPLAVSPRVLGPVIEDLELDLSTRQLANKVAVSSEPETVLIHVSVTDPDAKLAMRLSNAVSEEMGRVIEELEVAQATEVSNVRVSLAQPAEVPTTPSSPKVLLNLLLGLVAGLSVGFVLAVVRHHLDRRVKSSEDVRELTGISVLGTTVRERNAARRPLVTLDWRTVSAERYRTIRTALKFATVDRELGHFAITSALAGEGKTTVACNLAVSWAQGGASVCLVEADLRRPGAAAVFGIEGVLGLSDVLVGETSLEDVLLPWNHGTLSVLPAGSLPPDPAALLGSSAMKSLVGALRDRFDVVIYDCPPVLSVTDVLVLGRHTDGAVIVIGAGGTSRDQVTQAMESLRSARVPVLGTVLNAERLRRGTPEHDYQSSLSHDRAELSPRSTARQAPDPTGSAQLESPVVVDVETSDPTPRNESPVSDEAQREADRRRVDEQGPGAAA